MFKANYSVDISQPVHLSDKEDTKKRCLRMATITIVVPCYSQALVFHGEGPLDGVLKTINTHIDQYVLPGQNK